MVVTLRAHIDAGTGRWSRSAWTSGTGNGGMAEAAHGHRATYRGRRAVDRPLAAALATALPRWPRERLYTRPTRATTDRCRGQRSTVVALGGRSRWMRIAARGRPIGSGTCPAGCGWGGIFGSEALS